LICRVAEEYRVGAHNFVNMARVNEGNIDTIVCSCVLCRNLKHLHSEEVYKHLVIHGMDSTYTTWVLHGECQNAFVQCADVEMPESYNMYKEVFFQGDNVAEPTHERRDEEFTNLVEDVETPLYSGCKKYTRMSSTIVLFKHKATNSLSDKSFNQLLEIIRDMLPQEMRYSLSSHLRYL
jgi:hypothetical protein